MKYYITYTASNGDVYYLGSEHTVGTKVDPLYFDSDREAALALDEHICIVETYSVRKQYRICATGC